MDDELFEAFDPKVLAANGIEYPLSNPHDLRTRVQWWAYLMQTNGHLALHRMRIPPEGIIRFPEFMEKGWGWWRLLPIYGLVGSDMPLYKQYLCEYYIRNPPESVEDAAASTEERIVTRSRWTNENGRLIPLANMCLEMETNFMTQCEKAKKKLTQSEVDLSNRIIDRAGAIIKGEGEYVGAYAAAAALVCIAKEAELMSEWVIHGKYNNSGSECMESNQFREHALSLMFYKGSGSISAAAGAAMVGAAKEAKLLSKWLRQDLQGQRLNVTMCTDIREEACNILRDMCGEACAATGNSIAAADDGAEESTRANTVVKFFCIESSDEEDPVRKVGNGGCTKMTALNGNKENMENVNQKIEEGRKKLKKKMHHNSLNGNKESMENANQKTGEERKKLKGKMHHNSTAQPTRELEDDG